MVSDKIIIKGACEHNLKNISLELPKNKLIVFTGLSGSGKSSLAFDTLYAEGQRRYVESLSSYARQFLGMLKKPKVETIEGLSPAIAIDQKSVSSNPRSTVGTITEIYDYLRLLYARIGIPHCPKCGRKVTKQSSDTIVSQILKTIEQETIKKEKRIGKFLILSPVVRARKGEFIQLFESLRQKGFTKIRIDKQFFSLDDDFVILKTNKHDIDAVLDKLTFDSANPGNLEDKSFINRLTAAVETSLKLSNGLVILVQILDPGFEFENTPKKTEDVLFSEKFSCPVDNISMPELEPRTFSFNSPFGACPKCSGIGSILKVDEKLIINPNLSIKEGGILPFSNTLEQDTWYTRTVFEVAKIYDIPLRVSISEIPEEKLRILLDGTVKEEFTVFGTNRFGENTKIVTNFDGFLANLEQKFWQSDSIYMKAEIEKYMRSFICPDCLGKRLKPEALAVTINDKSISQVAAKTIDEAFVWIANLSQLITPKEQEISAPIVKEIKQRLSFLVSVGLTYLTLDRTSGSLAGGEAQRIRLASQIGSGLSGVLYILDEPSIGLHQRDNKKLINTLKNLRDLGNTVIVVEHDREMMENADWIVDFGPLAGGKGGQIVFSGKLEDIKKQKNSLTGKYLQKTVTVKANGLELAHKHGFLTIVGAASHNLKNIKVAIPLRKFVCVTGVSGSGKSTLVTDTLYHALALQLHRYHSQKPGKFATIEGWESLKNVILVDQSPIGRTPRSNPATYVQAFAAIREIFSQTKQARVSGFKPGRFSFNVKGGRCENCKGEGQIKIEMQFLAPIWVDCEICKGKRYNRQTLDITFKDLNISQVLGLTVDEALDYFKNIPTLFRKLQTLQDVGLGYIKLGQSAPTLSGGEAQRVKLAKELSKSGQGQTIYMLDEPTTGLHYEDLKKLLVVLKRLVEKGNTVLVIEHNLEMIVAADWIIDLGPEGGNQGGEVVVSGTVQTVSQEPRSYTGRFLSHMLR